MGGLFPGREECLAQDLVTYEHSSSVNFNSQETGRKQWRDGQADLPVKRSRHVALGTCEISINMCCQGARGLLPEASESGCL